MNTYKTNERTTNQTNTKQNKTKQNKTNFQRFIETFQITIMATSTKEYCLGAENQTNSWCKQLSRMYKEYDRNHEIIKDVRFTKEMIFTYHMINTDDSREGRGKWLEINFKCFGNIGHFKNINDLEKFYDTIK